MALTKINPRIRSMGLFEIDTPRPTPAPSLSLRQKGSHIFSRSDARRQAMIDHLNCGRRKDANLDGAAIRRRSKRLVEKIGDHAFERRSRALEFGWRFELVGRYTST